MCSLALELENTKLSYMQFEIQGDKFQFNQTVQNGMNLPGGSHLCPWE